MRAPTLGDDITRKTKSENIKSEQLRRKHSENMGKKFGQLFFKPEISKSNPMVRDISAEQMSSKSSVVVGKDGSFVNSPNLS